MVKMIKNYPLIPLVEEFIRKSKTSRRQHGSGKRISPGTVDNYRYLLLHLRAFEKTQTQPLRIRPHNRLNKQQQLSEKSYWKKCYIAFTGYLHRQGCFDNYTGYMMKALRVVFRYIEVEKMIQTGGHYKEFFITKEEIPIISLQPQQLQFLIQNREFEQGLNTSLQTVKNIFVLGCTVALRFSDLINIGWKDIERVGEHSFLSVSSQKTDTLTRIRLPQYAVAILEQYRKGRKRQKTIFPYVSLSWFNICIRSLCERAGWTEERGKSRKRKGVSQQLLHPERKKPYRLCDLVSSHVMRKTAITTMLMHGVPEHVVKKVSGHSSKAFYRYVNLVQSYMDGALEQHFDTLQNPAPLQTKDGLKCLALDPSEVLMIIQP